MTCWLGAFGQSYQSLACDSYPHLTPIYEMWIRGALEKLL